MKIIITGSEGLLGTEISKFLEKKHNVIKVDLELGHDLTNEKFVKKFFKKNKAQALINCFAMNDHVAPNVKRNTLFEIKLNSLTDFLNVNVVALFSVCREYARNNSNGAIVNFSGILGIVSARPDLYNGDHKNIGYTVSKAAVINLTKYLATHFAPNIRVNCVAPGGVEYNQNTKFKQAYSKLTPLGRMMNKNELNYLIEFLSSKKSSYVTGSTFVIDGGWTAW